MIERLFRRNSSYLQETLSVKAPPRIGPITLDIAKTPPNKPSSLGLCSNRVTSELKGLKKIKLG